MNQSPLQQAKGQQQVYVNHRRLYPSLFGNGSDGSMDGTPETGPSFVLVPWRDQAGQYQIDTFWSVHKHAWPLQFIYFFGQAVDSRGERSAHDLCIDIRDLKKAIGGNRIRQARWGSKSHIEVLKRALSHHGLASQIAEATIPF